MNYDPQITVAFTGHRTYDHDAESKLRDVIRMLYHGGKRVFMSGMAVGFDLAAAEAVEDCRKTCPEIRLVAVVPFRNQEMRFHEIDRQRYAQILSVADEVVTLANFYAPTVYAVRNNYLVDHSSALITWYDGSSGGTQYTVRRALHRRLSLHHLNPRTPLAVYPQPTLF